MRDGERARTRAHRAPLFFARLDAPAFFFFLGRNQPIIHDSPGRPRPSTRPRKPLTGFHPWGVGRRGTGRGGVDCQKNKREEGAHVTSLGSALSSTNPRACPARPRPLPPLPLSGFTFRCLGPEVRADRHWRER